MAIIIKGEMPKGISKNCYFCGYARVGDWNTKCGITGKIIDVGFSAPKQKDCPIIGKISDAHGDLIDEADLRKRAYELQRRDVCTFPEALALALINAPVVLGDST